MKRLVNVTQNGTFSVKGVDFATISNELYMIICKLKDYEALGLNPNDIVCKLYEIDDLKEELERAKKDLKYHEHVLKELGE